MVTHTPRFITYKIVIAIISACLSISTMAQTADSSAFRLGKVTLNPARQERSIAPMAEFLGAQLDYNETGTVYTRNISEMVQAFARNEVEFFTGSFWEAAVLVNEGVAEPVAIKFKRQSPSYRSLIVVRRDSDIDHVEDLTGKLVAFEDPDSTSAFRVPYLHMRKAGLNMARNIRRPNSGEVVHYRFSNAEQISSAWLYRGVVDAISISDSDWAKADNVPDFQKNQYRVIYTSPEIPRAVEVVRKSLPVETRQRLREILLDPNLPYNHASVLDDYHETSGFIEFDAKTLKELESFPRNFAN